MTFEDRRQRAVDHHVQQLRAAVQALRGLGQHDEVAKLLADERDDTVIEMVLTRTREPARMTDFEAFERRPR